MYDIAELLKENSYPGRGIIVGTTPDEYKAVAAYFIMGRSENSRNRIFELTEDGIRTKAFDESKMVDPSLIIYNPVHNWRNFLMVSNGDQTDTIYEYVKAGKTFEEALATRTFEPDAPNFTPRISAMLAFGGGTFSYKLNILKCIDGIGKHCGRFTFKYPACHGLGHFIHTYKCDGDPIPSFEGEPEPVNVLNDIDAYSELLWNNLNNDNKVSLYVKYTNLFDGKAEVRIFNKNLGD